ncbi:hypothetical protein KOW79_005566 [Hemibagrus wyckioides]|uniref:Uncharacterized protein n=1 Tax=Hemibagrus wyckioides TaxID=337641 RepID=A0A9D3SPE5_9TELE|nr:hypothetical protein KOW79_005566 [Hemibagrus wyckioides]
MIQPPHLVSPVQIPRCTCDNLQPPSCSLPSTHSHFQSLVCSAPLFLSIIANTAALTLSYLELSHGYTFTHTLLELSASPSPREFHYSRQHWRLCTPAQPEDPLPLAPTCLNVKLTSTWFRVTRLLSFGILAVVVPTVALLLSRL